MSDDDLDPKEVARHFNESLESNMRLYEQVFGEGPETAPKEASMAMPEKPSENAERVNLQWNDGWGTWQEVMPKHAGEPGVVTFIRASTHQRALEALETIASLHIPDMPAHFGGDELEWAQRHVASLRRIAAEALTRIKEASDAQR